MTYFPSLNRRQIFQGLSLATTLSLIRQTGGQFFTAIFRLLALGCAASYPANEHSFSELTTTTDLYTGDVVAKTHLARFQTRQPRLSTSLRRHPQLLPPLRGRA